MLTKVTDSSNISRVEVRFNEHCFLAKSISVDLPETVIKTTSADPDPSNILVQLVMKEERCFHYMDDAAARLGQNPQLDLTIHTREWPDYPIRMKYGFITHALYPNLCFLAELSNQTLLKKEQIMILLDTDWIPHDIRQREKEDPTLSIFRNILE